MTAKPLGLLHRLEREFRRQTIRDAIEAHGGNRTQAAKALGIDRTYLRRLIRELWMTSELTTEREP